MTNEQYIWLGSGAAALGLAGILHLRSYTHAAPNQSWPKAEARVTSAAIKTERGGDMVNYDRFTVKYAYEVDGQAFHSHFFSDKTENFAALATKYPDGAVFPVFYNPRNHGHSDAGDSMGLMGGFSWRRVAYGLYLAGFVAICEAWFLP
jgi:hypothetical protein